MEIPNQFQGKKKFELTVTERVKCDAIIRADNEDDALDKAEKLAQMNQLDIREHIESVEQEIGNIKEVDEEE